MYLNSYQLIMTSVNMPVHCTTYLDMHSLHAGPEMLLLLQINSESTSTLIHALCIPLPLQVLQEKSKTFQLYLKKIFKLSK